MAETRAHALKREARQRRHEMPPRLTHRRRELSCAPSRRSIFQWTVPKAIVQQLQGLFSLPLELRQEIYKHVLGCSTIHIYCDHQRMHSIECIKRRPDDDLCFRCRDERRHCRGGTDLVYLRRQEIPAREPIHLLQTCRQAYIETINMLYNNNTLHFSRATAFNYFVNTILPVRLAAIRSLSVSFCAKKSVRLGGVARGSWASLPRNLHPRKWVNLTDDWDPMWQTIKTQMRGLKTLKLTVYGEQRLEPHEEEMLFEPIKSVSGLHALEVEIWRMYSPTTNGLLFLLYPHPYTDFVPQIVELLPSSQAIIAQACYT